MTRETDFCCEVHENAILLGQVCDIPEVADFLIFNCKRDGREVVKTELLAWLEECKAVIDQHVKGEIARRFGRLLIDLHCDSEIIDSVVEAVGKQSEYEELVSEREELQNALDTCEGKLSSLFTNSHLINC